MLPQKLARLLCGLIWVGLLQTLPASEPSQGEQGPSERPAAVRPGTAPAAELPAQLQRWATNLLRENLPEEYHDRRQWGMQRDCLSGFDVRFEDGRLQTRRRYRPMNHGTWKRYQLRPIDPEQTLRVHIGPARPQPDGRTACTVELDARLHGLAQWVEWCHGLRLWSVTAEGDARVQLQLDCLYGVQWDLSQLPPELLLKPEIVRADFRLADFELRRIGPLEGPVVEELGAVLRQLAQWQLNQQRKSLTKRLNQQVAKHQDQLRLSARGKLPLPILLPAPRANSDAAQP